MLRIVLTIATVCAICAYAATPKPILPKYKNPTLGEFPIMGWYSIPDSASTPERYREMREAGFNLSFSHFGNNAEIARAVRAAKGSGIRIIAGSPVLEANPRSSIDTLKKYPEIAAWFLRDEPVVPNFKQLAQFRDSVYAADDSRLVYLNLLPRMVAPHDLGTDHYDNYLREFLNQIRLPMISYDMYPVYANNDEANLTPMLFTNLESARRVSKEFGVPFWAFCMSTAHNPYALPRPSHLEIEAFSALAYGAQAIQYFTYWQPVTQQWNFHHAAIDQVGKRTDVYYMIQNLNREIQALAPVFLDGEVLNVWHTGANIPDDTKPLTSLPKPFLSVTSDGPGLLVSHIRNHGRQYLMIVNRDILHAQRVDFALQAKSIQQIMPNGKSRKCKEHSLTIPPGRYLLFTWR